nr:helix-turn-helix domain-containing protein [Saliphagus infecundisoli]
MSEEDLSALAEVVETAPLGRASGRDVYQLTTELEDVVSEAFAPERFTATQMEPTVVTPEGWYEKKLFQNYNAFSGMRTRCEEYGIEIDLVSISQNPPEDDGSSQYGLTDRQHEALRLAISRDYYESPRQASTEELADEMDISQPSMSSLLRRGERQLLTTALGSQPRVDALTR